MSSECAVLVEWSVVVLFVDMTVRCVCGWLCHRSPELCHDQTYSQAHSQALHILLGTTIALHSGHNYVTSETSKMTDNGSIVYQTGRRWPRPRRRKGSICASEPESSETARCAVCCTGMSQPYPST